MIWLVINGILFVVIASLGLIQYLAVTRKYYFDKAIYGLRALKHDAAIRLYDESNNNENQQFIHELRELINIAGLTLDFFEKYKSRRLTPNTFKRIFLKIDECYKVTNKSFIKPTPQIEWYIIRYCSIMLSAFSTEFFFRYKFLTRFLIFFIKVLVKLGLGRLNKAIPKIQRIQQTYSAMQNAVRHDHPSPC